jgi:exodeoxyribonuclease VII small subunit
MEMASAARSAALPKKTVPPRQRKQRRPAKGNNAALPKETTPPCQRKQRRLVETGVRPIRMECPAYQNALWLCRKTPRMGAWKRGVLRAGRGGLVVLSFCIVAHSSKSAGQNASAKTLSFEDALKRLEDIVEAMESGDLSLEALLAKYEEGAQLAKICREKLAEAEVKIQQLEKTAAGEIKLKPVNLVEEQNE